MGAVLKIIDKQPGQPEQGSFELHLMAERLTARELICRRVAEEIKLINERGPNRECARAFLVQVEPGPVEQQLNLPKYGQTLSEEAEFTKALRGFGARSYVMLFNDRQVDSLDEELTVTENSKLIFLRMVPLVGG